MHSALALSLLVALCASASAAPMHHLRARLRLVVRPSEGVVAPEMLFVLAVPPALALWSRGRKHLPCVAIKFKS
jgi:hypothetical protein